MFSPSRPAVAIVLCLLPALGAAQPLPNDGEMIGVVGIWAAPVPSPEGWYNGAVDLDVEAQGRSIEQYGVTSPVVDMTHILDGVAGPRAGAYVTEVAGDDGAWSFATPLAQPNANDYIFDDLVRYQGIYSMLFLHSTSNTLGSGPLAEPTILAYDETSATVEGDTFAFRVAFEAPASATAPGKLDVRVLDGARMLATRNGILVPPSGSEGTHEWLGVRLALPADATQITRIELVLHPNRVPVSAAEAVQRWRFDAFKTFSLADAREARDGEHVRAVAVTDADGGPETHGAITLRIDRTLPIVTSAVGGIECHAGWNVEPVSFSSQASDAMSGLRSQSYTVNGVGGTYQGPVAWGQQGIARFVGRATDRAGNVAEAEVCAKADWTAPTGSIRLDGEGAGAGETFRGPVTVSVLAADALSGVAGKACEIEGLGMAPTIPFTVEGHGRFAVFCDVTDRAGNLATLARSFVIDTTPPEVLSRWPEPGSVMRASDFMTQPASMTHEDPTIPPGSGIDPVATQASMRVLLEVPGLAGQPAKTRDVTAFAFGDESFTSVFADTEWTPGRYRIVGYVYDGAGNRAVAGNLDSWSFEVVAG